MKTLVGPVYETEHKTLFAEVEKKAESLKNLAGVLSTISQISHPNSKIPVSIGAMINFPGPLYKIDNKHSYNEFETQVCPDYQQISPILL